MEIAGFVAGLKQLAEGAVAFSPRIANVERTLHWKAAAALERMGRENEWLKDADRVHLGAHQSQVARLEARVADLEAENDRLRARVTDLEQQALVTLGERR